MGKRKKHEEEHENHERWLVSYADFITLLFAFFVVMYAISSVNEGKYRVLSNALNTAFSDVSVDTTAPPPTQPKTTTEPPAKPGVFNETDQVARREKFRSMARDINDSMAGLIKEGQIHVTEGAFGLTIDISSNLLFASGDARLKPDAIASLEAIAKVLAGNEFPLSVEGHTDNLPINSAQFPSNWELSAVRASSVVRLFVDNGISPGRLTATGYADQRPLADNATPDGRQRNRRVSITIASKIEER